VKTELLAPEAYAALLPGARRVDLIETHSSWVFLVGEDVFKVKKPVDLGFLDFSTLEKRKTACDAEVRLNARLADGIYLGVVPLRRQPSGQVHVAGDGEIVDYAVHMKRLPDEPRADTLVRAGTLTPAMVDDIAVRLARFHAGCRVDGETRAFGTPAAIERNVEENFAQAGELLPTYLAADQAQELMRWQRAFLRGHAALFEQRAAEGRVRDGHGDLRLEHVYFRDEGVTVLDCIEFSDRFRFADVASDVAFLSMDLTAEGRTDLAERLLATYARESQDFDIYAVIDFYESYRAFVRGKISAMQAGDPSLSEVERKRAEADARRYFLLALSADRRSLLLPVLVAVGGVIASGKSTIAAFIGDEMSAPVVDADRTRKGMLGVAATEKLSDGAWQGAYDPSFTEAVYKEVWRRAGVVLCSGRPVVVDASFRAVSMRRDVRELAILHNAPFRFVECRTTPEVCRARLELRERTASVSDGRLAIFDSFAARYEQVNELLSTEHVVLDTARPVERSVEDLRSELDVWPRRFVT
jgi:hypothetical protein